MPAFKTWRRAPRRFSTLLLFGAALGTFLLVTQTSCQRGNASDDPSSTPPPSGNVDAPDDASGRLANGEATSDDPTPPPVPRDAAGSADTTGADVADSNVAAEDSASDSLNAGDSLGSPEDSSAASGRKSWKDRLFGDRGEKEEKADPAVPVETATVDRRDIPAYLSSTATLEPEKEATVLAKLSGQITRILVEEGDRAEQGALLAELDGAVQRIGLEEAAARTRGLALELERIRSLHDQKLSSDKALNDAQAEYDQAEANRKSNELLVEHTQIRAPFSGQISIRRVDPGQHVEAGRELFQIVDRSPLLARIYLPEHNVAGLAAGQEIWVESEGAGAADLLPGQVVRIAPVVDTRTGTVKVTCQFDDTDATLRPGSFVRVKVRTGVHEGVLAIPKRALVPEGTENFVFRTEGDSVAKVPVEIGFADADFVEVVEGLTLGDRIVTIGHGGLEAGSRIHDLTSSGRNANDDSAPPEDADVAAPGSDATQPPGSDRATDSGSQEEDSDRATASSEG